MRIKYLQQIFTIGTITWKESLRDRVQLIIGLFGIFLIGIIPVIARMIVGSKIRVIYDMGFWVLGIWGLALVMYLGANSIRKEIQSKTIYLILSRPIRRWQFVLGKLLGIIMVIFVVYIILSFFLILEFFVYRIDFSLAHFFTFFFIFLEWIMIACLSMVFASFTTPLMHNIFLISTVFLGHYLSDIRVFIINIKEPFLKFLLKVVYYTLPNLEKLNFKSYVIYEKPIPSELLPMAFIVWFSWCVFLVVLSIFIFNNRKIG